MTQNQGDNVEDQTPEDEMIKKLQRQPMVNGGIALLTKTRDEIIEMLAVTSEAEMIRKLYRQPLHGDSIIVGWKTRDVIIELLDLRRRGQ